MNSAAQSDLDLIRKIRVLLSVRSLFLQVKPFRKNDKSIALSSSPLSAAFDPNKTPDFGLLKSRKPKHQNEKKLSAA